MEITLEDIKKDIHELKNHLLKSDISDKIVKIYLFGSHVKGEATKDSDIDVLIFTSDGAQVDSSLMDTIFDFQLTRNIPIEVITSHVNDLYPLQDYFIYNALRYGLEIYSMEEMDIKKEAVRNLLNLAEEYLESAEEVLENGRFRLAVDAAYNTAELSVKGLILLKQDDLPGNHGGVVNMFGQLYITTGEISKDIGRSLHVCLKLRNNARYKSNEIVTRDNSKEVISLARTLIKLTKEKIGI